MLEAIKAWLWSLVQPSFLKTQYEGQQDNLNSTVEWMRQTRKNYVAICKNFKNEMLNAKFWQFLKAVDSDALQRIYRQIDR